MESIVGPASELHDAGLLVEGEVLDVHLAGRVVNGRWPPLHEPGVEQRGLGRQGHLEVAVGATETEPEVEERLTQRPLILSKSLGLIQTYYERKNYG